MTKISIIMPVYNGYNFLDKSIGSIVNQTLSDIELICIDDGSTDESIHKLNYYADKYDFIKVFSQQNQGPGKARNYGIELAKGEYVGFLDADDIFLDVDALEKMYDVGKENNSDIVSANIGFVSQDFTREDNPHYFLGDYAKFEDYGKIESKDYGIPYAFYKNIFNRQFLIDNNIIFPDLIVGEDPIFMANVLVCAKEVTTVPLDLYGYNHSHGGGVNLKTNTFEKKKDYIKHFKETFDILENGNLKDLADFYKFHLLKYLSFGRNYYDDEIFSIFDSIFGLEYNYFEKNIKISSESNTSGKIYKKLYNQLMLFKSVYDFLSAYNLINFYYESEKTCRWFIDHLNMDDLKILLIIINDFYDHDSRIFNDFNGYIFYKFHKSPNFAELSEFNIVPNKPSVSIISRIYDWADFIWSNYYNIMDQSYYNFEVIFVCEDSKDNSFKILNDIAKKDFRITIIDNRMENKNLSWKKALDIAKGDYIFLHNPKYKYSKTTIESLYKNAVLTNSDVFLFKINNEFDTGFDDLLTYDLENVFQDKTFGFFTFSYKDIREYIMGAVLSPWFKFYNKQFLYENDDLYLGLDNSLNFIALHISSLLMANNISFLPVSFNYEEYDSDQIQKVKISDVINILNEINIFLNQEGLEKYFHNEYNMFVIYLIYKYMDYFNSKDYFNLSKKILLSLSVGDLPFDYFKKYDMIVNSQSFDEFKFKNNLILDSTTYEGNELIHSLYELKVTGEDIWNNNNNIKEEIEEITKFNSELFSSSSWKLTKGLRKIKKDMK